MAQYNAWQILGQLGEGGQGTVYKARSPIRVQAVQESVEKIYEGFRSWNANYQVLAQVAERMVDVGGPDPIDTLGALKVFRLPQNDEAEKSKALMRLQEEMKALRELQHPNVLKFFDGSHMSVEPAFIVTEYHPQGTLDRHLHAWKGNPLGALNAFRPLVEAIVAIHSKNAIHRDIKTQNIFVAVDGRLVLGDFGIVFFRDAQHTRFTETFGERVGSHFWMAPWAYEPKQLNLERISPPLDIYPLAKVLWSMIAGRDGFSFWEYASPENDLEILFPEDPKMAAVNALLSKCIVRHEKDCLHSASALLTMVDTAIYNIRHEGQKPDGDRRWLCRICGKGRYVRENMTSRISVEVERNVTGGSHPYSAYICDNCHHVQFFRV